MRILLVSLLILLAGCYFRASEISLEAPVIKISAGEVVFDNAEKD